MDFTLLWTLTLASWTLPFLWYSHLFHGRGSLNLHPRHIGAISMKVRLSSYALTALYFTKHYHAYTLLDWIPLYAPIRMCICALFIMVGQIFNTSVYKSLGVTGVYYGRELGYPPPPWINGFPFIIPHPQYIGCIMTIIGGGGWFGFSLDGPRMHMLYLATYVTGLYTYAMMSERTPQITKSMSAGIIRLPEPRAPNLRSYALDDIPSITPTLSPSPSPPLQSLEKED